MALRDAEFSAKAKAALARQGQRSSEKLPEEVAPQVPAGADREESAAKRARTDDKTSMPEAVNAEEPESSSGSSSSSSEDDDMTQSEIPIPEAPRRPADDSEHPDGPQEKRARVH